MRHSIYRWFATNSWPGDAVIALVVCALALFDAAQGGAAAPLGLIAAIPLLFRRSYPVEMLLASIVVQGIVLTVTDRPLASSASVLLVIYAAVVYPAQRLWGYVALAAGIFGAVAAPSRWYAFSRPAWLVGIALLLALVAVAFVAGDRRRSDLQFRAAELRALNERTALVTAERDQRIQFAAAAERTRIARELHDIVAHSLAVIVVQADGGAAAAAKNPAVAEPVLRTIAETSRTALAEMRALVGVLRADPAHPGSGDYLPQPGIASLDRLIDGIRQSGVAVEVLLPDPVPVLTPTLDLTVYRIIQEGLTNVLKHAGPAATAHIEVAVQGREIAVDVIDDGRGAATLSDGAGNGIQGMRERVAVLDGALWAGPRPDGGFRLRAVLPLGRL